MPFSTIHLWAHQAGASRRFAGAVPVLVLGLYWKRASRCGAMIALVLGLTALAGLEPIRGALGLGLRAETLALAAAALSLVGMVIGSILVPDREPRALEFPDESADVGAADAE